MVSLTIDGKKCEAPEGQSILDAAASVGIYIPTLCAHPALEPEGSWILRSGGSEDPDSVSFPVRPPFGRPAFRGTRGCFAKAKRL